jgi:hypothetical protein
MKITKCLLSTVSIVGLLITSACATQHPAQEPSPASGANGTSARASGIAPVKDKRAMEAWQTMADTLSKASSMRFVSTVMKPMHGPNDQWIHILTVDTVEMQRPNKLMVSAGGDAYPQKVYFDGENFSVSAPEDHLYSTGKVNGNVDNMLADIQNKGGVSFPFADVLLADPMKSWSEGLEGAAYIGESTRGNKKLSHIALTAKDVDWEIWIDQKMHVPRIVYVKYTGVHRAPSVLIEFSKWKLNDKIAASTFQFKPMSGAKKVSFAAPTTGVTK